MVFLSLAGALALWHHVISPAITVYNVTRKVTQVVSEMTEDTVDFQGTVSYSINRSAKTVELHCDKIVKKGANGTGTLKVQLWAITESEKNRINRGYILAEFTLDPLEGNSHYYDIDRTLSMNIPPPGEYPLGLELSSYHDDESYYTEVTRIFKGLFKFRSERILIRKSCYLSETSTHFLLRMEDIFNDQSCTSGTIEICLWAFDNVYDGGSQSGYRLCQWKLDPLAKNYSYVDNNLKFEKSKITFPSRQDWYYITVVVSQYQNDKFLLEDYKNFSKQQLLYPEIVELSGTMGYTIRGDEIEVRMQKISNKLSRSTNNLKVLARAHKSPYKAGSTSQSYLLATCEFDSLSSDYYYDNVKRTCKIIMKPESGTYFITFHLQESGSQKDYHTFDKSEYFD